MLVSHFYTRWCDYDEYVKKKLDKVSVEKNIENYCKKNNQEWFLPMLSKFLYFQLFDEKGNCHCDYAIIYDKLEDGLKIFCDKFKLNKPRFNIKHNTGDSNYKKYYNDERKRLVKNKCKLELEMFNFDFDGYKGTESLINIKDFKIDPKTLI